MQLRTTHWLLALATAAGLIAADSAGPAKVMMEAARKMEVVDGNLNGAIKQYAAIVTKYLKTDRAVTARAMVHMAECYQKMGNAESRKLYEQVVREYADQKEAVDFARARLGRPEGATRQTSTLVWSSPKVDPEGSVSFDGRYISYPDWETGDLGIRELATGTERRLINKGTWKDSNDFAEQSAISRDGKQIAYAWYNDANRRYELRLANLTGDPKPHRLFDNPDTDWIAPFDWSPDGKWIAAWYSREDRTSQIVLFSVPEGEMRVLKSIDWRGTTRISFSPDGKYISYDLSETETSRQRDVFVLATDGSREIPAVVRRGDDAVVGWSPDGKLLLFASNRTGPVGLWGQRFADGKPQGTPELIKADIGDAASLGVTRSGALYYGMFTGGRISTIGVSSFDFATGKLVSPVKDLPQEFSFEENRYPLWSPDGKLLCYVSRRGRMRTSNFALVMRSADTGQIVRELPVKLDYFAAGGWLPDGRSILAEGRDFKGRNGIYQIDAQTGELSLIIAMDHAQAIPILSPDGRSIYYRRNVPASREFAFVQRDLASGNEKELLRRHRLGAPNVSPDGRFIATLSTDVSTKRNTMILIPLSGGEPREMIRAADDEESIGGVAWAPDSRSFYTWKNLNDRKKRAEAWHIPIDGAKPRKLDPGPEGPVGPFRVHPDGKRVAIILNERPAEPPPSEVWMLENFLPASK